MIDERLVWLKTQAKFSPQKQRMLTVIWSLEQKDEMVGERIDELDAALTLAAKRLYGRDSVCICWTDPCRSCGGPSSSKEKCVPLIKKKLIDGAEK